MQMACNTFVYENTWWLTTRPGTHPIPKGEGMMGGGMAPRGERWGAPCLQWQSPTPCGVLHTRALKQLSLCHSIYAGLWPAQEGDGEHDPIRGSPWDAHQHLFVPAAASHSGSLGCSQKPVAAPKGQVSVPECVWHTPYCRQRCRPRHPGEGEQEPWGGNLLGMRCRPKQRRERAMLPPRTAGD